VSAEAPAPSWNPLRDLAQMLEYHFMINALLAGSAVAVTAALVGWMMVLRRETFAGHTLAVMAFPGAAAAALAGVPAAAGYLLFCGAGALAIARLGAAAGSWREESAGVGVVQAFALGLGFLFVSLYGGVLGDLETLLFGDVLGVSDGQVIALVAVAVAVLAALAAVGRPLLFSSVDTPLAAARGLPVRRLALAFLAMLAVAVASTSQVTGPLLVLALLVIPAASARVVTARPAASLALSLAIALIAVWAGLGIAYFSVYPPSMLIATVAFACYLLARLTALVRARRERRGREAPSAAQPPAPGLAGAGG
jgi:zinc/manganese transport system permease protein